MSAILKKRAPLALAVALAIFCAASPLAERRDAHAVSSVVGKVVVAGDPAPGGGTFTGFSCSACYNGVAHVGLNDTGQVAFRATVSTGSIGIFTATPGPGGFVLEKIAAASDPKPAGGAFSDFSSPSINASGEVAFGAMGGVRGIFAASRGPSGFEISKVAATYDSSPIGGIFVGFYTIDQTPAVNAA